MGIKTPGRKALATLGVAAIALAALAGTSSAANAIDPQDFGNIDGDREGSITVHKFLHQDGDETGDPENGPTADQFSDPVEGVIFTAYPLLKDGQPLDVMLPATWDGLATVSAGANCTAPTGYTLGTGIPLPATDPAGVATLVVTLGAYQVCETSAPANIIETADPFIVTIPMPHAGGWLYDVNAYPKNGAAEINKSITLQEGLGLGSSVLFPVTVNIPKVVNLFTELAIVDTLDSNFSPNPDGEAGVGVASVTLGGVDLDIADYNVVVTGNTVRVELTALGLAKADAQQGAPWVVTFDAIIESIGATGSINNVAELVVNGKPPLPSPIVTTNWGSLEVIKRNVGTTGETGKLGGAVFEVYNSTDPFAADCSTVTSVGDPIAVDGSTTFTSASNGVISVAGLFVSDSENPVVNNPTRCYVLKEVAAPAGYVLPADPFTAVTVQIGETDSSVNVDIENTQTTVPALPLTGGAGTALLVGFGVAAVAVAAVLMSAKRRKAHETV